MIHMCDTIASSLGCSLLYASAGKAETLGTPSASRLLVTPPDRFLLAQVGTGFVTLPEIRQH
ncbi:MAG: hypothetical protein V3R81_15100, partial [Gammaproteobacteria bacterium]